MILDKNGNLWNWTVESPVIQKLIQEDDKRNAKVAAAVDAGDMEKAKQLCEDIPAIDDVLEVALHERGLPYECEILPAQKRKDLGLYTNLLGPYSPALVFYYTQDYASESGNNRDYPVPPRQIDDTHANEIIKAVQDVLGLDQIGLFTPQLALAMEHLSNWIGAAIDCMPISHEFIQFHQRYTKRYQDECRGEMEFHNAMWEQGPAYIREKVYEFANLLSDSSICRDASTNS